MKSYLLGTVLFLTVGIPLLGVCGFAVLSAVAQEVDNRTNTRLRQQWNLDKKHMLKLDNIRRGTNTRECQLSDDEIRCVVYPGGQMKIAVSN